MGFEVAGYDQYFATSRKPFCRKYDFILCTYVLCTIELEINRLAVLADIRNALKKNGSAFITVRRNVPNPGRRKSGFWMGEVKLDLPSILKTSGFETYLLKQ